MAPSLPELKEHLDSTLRHSQSGIVVAVQDQGLEWMIPVGPFQLRMFSDSMKVISFLDTLEYP